MIELGPDPSEESPGILLDPNGRVGMYRCRAGSERFPGFICTGLISDLGLVRLANTAPFPFCLLKWASVDTLRPTQLVRLCASSCHAPLIPRTSILQCFLALVLPLRTPFIYN